MTSLLFESLKINIVGQQNYHAFQDSEKVMAVRVRHLILMAPKKGPEMNVGKKIFGSKSHATNEIIIWD